MSALPHHWCEVRAGDGVPIPRLRVLDNLSWLCELLTTEQSWRGAGAGEVHVLSENRRRQHEVILLDGFCHKHRVMAGREEALGSRFISC